MSTINRAAVERLYEDETLTKDLNDATAKVLLKWGQAQLEEGRLEQAVRREVKVLAQVVRDREGLTAPEATLRLSAAGLNVDEKGLADLWEQIGGNEAEWVSRLLTLVQTSPLLSQETVDQLNAPPAPVEEYPTPGEEAELKASPPLSTHEAEQVDYPPAPAGQMPAPRVEQAAPPRREMPAEAEPIPWWQFWRRHR